MSDTPVLAPPSKHHIDRRAAAIVAAGAARNPDELLTTNEVAEWTGLSDQFFEIGRCKGYGPRYLRLSPRRVRYRVGDVLQWLEERSHAMTAEYADPLAARPGRQRGCRVIDGRVVQSEEPSDAT